jgi:hypothetical protein
MLEKFYQKLIKKKYIASKNFIYLEWKILDNWIKRKGG